MGPKTLLVETGYSPLKNLKNEWWSDVLDYDVYEKVPAWWRSIEKLLRLDIVLSLKARQIAGNYDIIWANSEKVGIPLTGVKKPLVVITHHLASERKRGLLRFAGIVHKWDGIGYKTTADRDFIVSYYGVSHDRFIRIVSQNLTRLPPARMVEDGPIISLGVSKRDYQTLVVALSGLPEYRTEIYTGSRFDDRFAGSIRKTMPLWVRICKPVPSHEVPGLYQRARFVVLPIEATTQFSAGLNVALEASAAGKAVIATDLPGMKSYVIDGVTGILVPPHDPPALRAAIHKLWTHPELAYQMGLAGQRYVEDEFNKATLNDNIRKFLSRIYEEQNQK